MALSASLDVWFDAEALSLGDPQGRVSRTAAPSPPHTPVQGLGAALSSQPHKEPPHTAFYHSVLEGPFFISGCCSSSPSLKGVSVSLHHFLLTSPPSEVTAFKDGLGSEFTDLRLTSYLLLPDGSFIPYFLFHEVCSLFGHFLQSLCHTHRYNLLIGAIKEVKLQQRV